MPLVEYSSSSSSASPSPEHSTKATLPPSKRRRLSSSNNRRSTTPPAIAATRSHTSLPALPSAFHDLYATNARVSTTDDPSLHGGRKRAIPHAEGQWPSFVYIEWLPDELQARILEEVVAELKSVHRHLEVHSHLRSDVGTVLPLHISLSAPLVLRGEVKDDFAGDVKKALRADGAQGFEVNFASTRWFANEDRSRWFNVLKVASMPGNNLNTLLNASNRVARDYKQCLLYNNPDDAEVVDKSDFFHVSIAWALINPITSSKSVEEPRLLTTKQRDALRFKCSTVKVKVGNVVHSIPLSSDLEHDRGILG